MKGLKIFTACTLGVLTGLFIGSWLTGLIIGGLVAGLAIKALWRKAPRVTKKQIAAVKYLIFESQDGSNLAKQILALLLDKSEGLTKQVYITLQQDREGYTADEIQKAAVTMGGMTSSTCSTHLDEIMDILDTKFEFSIHYGSYEGKTFSSNGIFPGYEGHPLNAPLRYTFWLAEKSYGHAGGEIEIPVSRKELDEIDLTKPGLYPNLECHALKVG
jgi:hypothetical protein